MRPDPPAGTAAVALSELVVGGLAGAVALVAWASLALAHAGRHSAYGAVALAALAAGAAALAVRRLAPPPRVRADRGGLLAAALVGAVAAVLSFPGFGYGVTDKDPGLYVGHAVAIARHGSHELPDEVLARVPGVELRSPGARFPGVWIGDAERGTIRPQFYHLWPALLATAHEVAGLGGVVGTAPLLAVLAAMAATVLVRRVAGSAAGVLAGLLLATNMMQVWQAKYPSTEMLSQLLFLGTLLGVVVAITTRWAPAAGLAGLLAGAGFLNRPDGLLVVLAATAAGAALLAARRWDARAWWFAGGLALVAPHALWQAYVEAAAYTAENPGPSPGQLAAAVGCLLAAGAAVRARGRRPVDRAVAALSGRRGQRAAGLAVCAVAAALLVAGFLRPLYSDGGDFVFEGRVHETHDEQILRRLSWFVTLPGFALMGLGLAVATLRRWRAEVWAVVLPTLLVLPVYGYSAHVASRLMWWTRRYVPTVLPGIVVLVALALGWALSAALSRTVPRRRRVALGVPAALAAAFLLAVHVGQSWPLRRHDEFGGSFALTRRIAAYAGGRQGVFLWQRCTVCPTAPAELFGAAVWLERGQRSALLPAEPERRAAYVASLRRAFPGAPVFVVGADASVLDGLAGVPVEPVGDLATTLPVWQESDVRRPDRATALAVRLLVWRVAGT